MLLEWILAFDSGKMTMQEYKQRYFCIFKMTDKTGNSYTTGTKTDSAGIPTAIQVFLTTASPNKVSPNDHDNVRQPEMVLRPWKSEILISLEPRVVGWQFKRQIWGFWPRAARINWPRAIATTTYNRTWDLLGPHLQFPVVVRCRNQLATL